ncbi:Hypothetical predicted protein [Marmota monax]|uniref:Uncharacterized protein n=1 Tax=Marmota monax TaxID=9995 RepID=A0A5E4AY22_MARMO|nr:Hypothetical predicted protein [Marmota monax]
MVKKPVGNAPSLDLDASGAYSGLTLLAGEQAVGRSSRAPCTAERGPWRAGRFPDRSHGRGGGAFEQPRLSSGGLRAPQGNLLPVVAGSVHDCFCLIHTQCHWLLVALRSGVASASGSVTAWICIPVLWYFNTVGLKEIPFPLSAVLNILCLNLQTSERTPCLTCG